MKKKVLIGCLLIIVFMPVLAWWLFSGFGKLYFLSVTAIMKNEKPYLKEWLEYHLLQGVEHFYLCDNGSTDGTEEYLAPYIEKGTVTYISLQGINKQLECYENVVREHGKDSRWMAFLDIDEFLVPLQDKSISAFLREFSDVDEVSLHWMNYGDNNIFSRSGGLVTEDFTAHARFLNHTVKSVVRPEAVINFKQFGANHYVPIRGESVNEYHKPVEYMLDFNISGDKARVNHYIIKSFAEFLNKKSRGHPEGTAIDYGYYFFHNENDIKNDATMQRFMPALKKRMEQSPLADAAIPLPATEKQNFADFYFTPEEVTLILGEKSPVHLNYYVVQERYRQKKYPVYK